MMKKKILFVGDSIALAMRDTPDEQGLRGWAKHVCAAYQMEGLNAALAGAALNSKTRRPRFGEQAVIANQIRAHAGEGFDAVLIHGGLNDAWDGVPFGEITESFNTFDDTTFAGALEATFAACVQAFGKEVRLGWIINFNCPEHSATSDAEEYYEWGKKVCQKWGVPYLDLFHLPYDCKALNDDVLHPRAAGYDYLAPFVVEFIPQMKSPEV